MLAIPDNGELYTDNVESVTTDYVVKWTRHLKTNLSVQKTSNKLLACGSVNQHESKV